MAAMNIPSLPTDSLYKFLAIAGLTLVVLSPAYYQVFSWDVQLKKLELRGEQNLMAEEADDSEADAARMTAQVDSVVSQVDSLVSQHPTSQEEKARLLQHSKELREQNHQLLLKTREKLLKQIRIEAMAESVNLYDKQLSSLKVISIVAFILGLGLFTSGLYLWYTRVQRLQDMVLRKEAGLVQDPLPEPDISNDSEERPADHIE